MNNKKRLLNAINGKEIDYVNWSPFLAYFWEYQPEEVRQKGQLKYMEEIGAAPLLRGFVAAANISYEGVEIVQNEDSDSMTKEYIFEDGKLTEEYRFTQNTWFLIKHPVQSEEDMDVFIKLCKRIRVESNVENVNKALEEVGDRALVVPRIGVFDKSGFQSLLEHWIGTEKLIYALMDYPDKIDECLKILWEKSKQVAECAAQSNAEVFLSWEDTSTTNISPDYFVKYIRPELDMWCDILHAKGKKYLQHACGHLRHLLPFMAESKIDGVESLSPMPTGNIDVLEAREILPEHMVIIGGLEPVFLVKSGEEELKNRVKEVLSAMEGKRFILANSDSCPPEVSPNQFKVIRQAIQEYNDNKR